MRHEERKKILKEFIDDSVSDIESGKRVLVRGGYIHGTEKERVIDRNCDIIVQKLSSMGYTYTTNHGFGCFDYWFSKPMEL